MNNNFEFSAIRLMNASTIRLMKVSAIRLMKGAAVIVCCLIAVASTASAQTFIYDGVGRVSIVRYDGGLETRYAYDKNGNITSIRTQVINSVSEDGAVKADLTVIPNPTSDNAVVVLGELVSGMEITVTIRDLAGRTLVERTTRCEGDRITVDVSELSSGSYIIECHYEGVIRTSTLRVVR